MKRLHTIILSTLATLLLMSCENFRDNNGDLGGMWQLTQWRTRSSSGEIDSLVADNIYENSQAPNPRKIYYCIHNSVLQFEDASRDRRFFYFATFEHAENLLRIKTIVDKGDTVRTFLEAKDFGVPADGIFHINTLNNKNLTLTFDGNELYFRKY